MSFKISSYFEDIICAQATPEGVGAISLVRVSGQGSAALLSKLLEINVESLESHKAYYNKFYDEKRFVDEVLVTFFSKGKSFTGEESFEVTCHGSPLIVSDFMQLFIKHGARLAEPGEFSYRAYLNGKIDLTKAEGIHHSIHAQTELSKQLSLNLLEGAFKKTLLEIKNLVVWAASRVEASIDFSDQDIDLNHDKEVFEKINSAKNKAQSLLDSYAVGVVQAKGVSLVLCGPPNAGKSTLFNILVNDERSIVSAEKGTTRDYIKETLVLKSHPIQILDTAGLRESLNKIEAEGIKRSLSLAKKSQLTLYLVSEDTYQSADDYYDDLKKLNVPVLVVETKQDLGTWSSSYVGESPAKVSLKSEEGIEALKERIFERLEHYFKLSKGLFIERHKILMEEVQASLKQASNFYEISGTEDVISSLLYSSIDSLDEILYIDDPEAVRDQIFKDFCLGK